jgi:hypothetical protein
MRCVKSLYVSNMCITVGMVSILFVLVTCLPSSQSFALTVGDSGTLSGRRHDLLSGPAFTGQQNENYTNLGKSLGCTDLNTNSAHAAALAKVLNCSNNNKIDR